MQPATSARHTSPRARARLLALALPLALPLCHAPAARAEPLGAEAFAAHVTGKTVTYQQGDTIFGTEEYLPDRKVRWSVAPDLCQYGSWYPQDDDICFVYEYDPVPHCWTFWLKDGALVALSVGGLPGEELHEAQASDQPLPCPGPEVGV